jgi:hypothetical protein|tara:strand:- start:1135 stop:2850 length:1716 start_codon:yes stop_codon:yes gene_type:complete
MSDFKALENVSGRIQGIIKGSYTRCKNIIKTNVKITGGMGKDGNPKDIIGFMEAHGTGKKNRPGSARTFEGMGLALEMLDTLSKVEYVTNQNLEDLDKINEILLAMIRDTVEGKNATNPQNIRFKVVVGFKLNKRTGQPVKIQRDFVYGHFKTPTVLAYLAAKKKYMGSDYDGPEYSESAQQVKYWTSDKPNTSRPPLFIALQKFQAEITKIKDDIEEEPSPGDPIIINIDKGVSLAPFAKINSIKEGFIAILSNDAIYPKKPKDRKGSNKPVWVSDTRPNFRDAVNEYVFSVDETARALLDEAVPAWGDEPDDLAVTKIYDSFKIRVNSTRRMKTLARLCLGADARNIELPGRTSGVVLKSNVVEKAKPKKQKERMVRQAFEYLNNKPSSAQELYEVMASGKIKTSTGHVKRTLFSSVNSLSQFLPRYGYKKVGKGLAEGRTQNKYSVVLWEPKDKLLKTSENIKKARSRPKEIIIQQAFEHRNNEPTSARHLYEIMSSGVITTLRGTSKKKNPFRSVASLVGYMNSHGFKKADLKERSHRGAPSAGGRMYEGVLSWGGPITLYLPRGEE